MHGVCGDPLAFESWVRAATAHATFISMRGDLPCKSRPGRRKWSMRWSHLDARIAEALEVAARERGRSLDRDEVVLVGYSQGAARVEALAAAFPKRYRRVALIASPVEPSASRLGRAERTVLMAGGWDAREHIHKASLALARAGRDALYLELPKARHGEYGPDAERVMGRGLDWLFNGRASD
jgi:predicted esterase